MATFESLSRRKQGFESPWERQENQILAGYFSYGRPLVRKLYGKVVAGQAQTPTHESPLKPDWAKRKRSLRGLTSYQPSPRGHHWDGLRMLGERLDQLVGVLVARRCGLRPHYQQLFASKLLCP